MLEWLGPHYLSAPLQFRVHRGVAIGRCRDLQTYGSSVGAAWKHQSGLQLERHFRDSVGEGHRGGDHVRKWNGDSRRPKGLGAVFPARKCLSRQVSFGGHDIEAAAPLAGTNPWLGSFLFGTVENCLWPTLETVHAGSDQGRIHARALPLLWRHQSKRWGFMCLARRGLQLLCRGCRPVAAWEKTCLAPLAQSPLCLGGPCGSWKVCGPSGTWNWVRRAEINLHHCSPGETVRGERAKSVAKCC